MAWSLSQRVSDADMAQIKEKMAAEFKKIFTEELEEALLGGEIDLAVHSAKDLPQEMPAGRHSVTWDAGREASGVYFLRVAELSRTGREITWLSEPVILLR